MKIDTKIAQLSRGAPLGIIGDVNVDLIMGPLNTWPAIGTETIVEKSEMRAGGSAGNAALALAALGADVSLYAGTGADSLGEWLRAQFSGITAHFDLIAAPTSISVGVLHTSGERTFLTADGHLSKQGWDDIAGIIPIAPCDEATVLLTAPFLLPELRRKYAGIIIGLRGLGYRIALDTGWPPEGFTPEVLKDVRWWLSLVDHVLLNELEITSLAKTSDIDKAMEVLACGLRPGATLVAKMGAKGAIAICEDERATYTPPANPNIFDTVGAGDAFNAGYLFARARGLGLQAALVCGCDTATRIIGQFPRRHDLVMPTPQTSTEETF